MKIKPKHWWQRCWRPGRRGTGYSKLSLSLWRFDLHLIHYPVGSYLEVHTDPVQGFEHHRVNYVLWKAKSGGEFYWFGSVDWNVGDDRLIKFRPDRVPHMVSMVEDGTRVVLSFGWVKRQRKFDDA